MGGPFPPRLIPWDPTGYSSCERRQLACVYPGHAVGGLGTGPPCLARGVGTVLERRAGLILSRGTRCPAQDLLRGTGGPWVGPTVSPLPPTSANPGGEAPGPVGPGARPAFSPGCQARGGVGGRGAG